MMLNTDLCLLYNHVGTDAEGVFGEQRLNARRHSCCAWRDFHADGVGQVIANNDDTICGVECAPDSDDFKCKFFGLKPSCCASIGEGDCGARGGPHSPTGDAVADIMEFAENEEAWVNAFLDAWRKA